MAICKNCGAEIPDKASFCTYCGTPVVKADSTTPNQQTSAPKTNYTNPQNNYTENGAGVGSSDDKLMGVLSYLGILVLIPIFAAKNSEFAKFHASQGLTLFIIEVAYGIVQGLIGAFSFAGLRGIPFLNLFLSAVGVFTFVLSIIGIVNACNGQKKELPLIGGLDILGKFTNS